MTLLLTSFAPWKAHQSTNASDDLVELLQAQGKLPEETVLIRHLPVHSQLAPSQVLSGIFRLQPSVVVCCGMAEKRAVLSLERYARTRERILETSVDLQWLCQETQWTMVSHDAGDYVCNDLYYQILAHIQKHDLSIKCVFIHVPLLKDYNCRPIIRDLAIILERLCTLDYSPVPTVA